MQIIFLNQMLSKSKGLYAITPTYLRGQSLIDAVKETVFSGVKIIQYRFDERLENSEKLKTAERLLDICNVAETIFVINNDFHLANMLNTGLHIGQDIKDTSFLHDLDQIKLIGLSCKDDYLQQLREDSELFSYFSFGPVFNSKTKKNLKGTININLISEKMDPRKINVAIGGIDSDNIREINKNGFDMAAICEGIYNDPKKISENIKKLNKVWNEN